MTQGDPLFLTIFNMVVDTVLQHWVTVVEMLEEAVELRAVVTGVFARDMQILAAYLYDYYGILVPT